MHQILFFIESLNKVALCLFLLGDVSQLIEALNSIDNFLIKYGPFKNKEIKCLISNNSKHFNGDLAY